MSLRVLGILVLAVFVSLGATSKVEADPVVTLDASNLGIGTLGVVYDDATKTITITEDWTSSLMGSLLISELEPNVDYTIVKEITNSTGRLGAGWPMNCSIRLAVRTTPLTTRCPTPHSFRQGTRRRATSTDSVLPREAASPEPPRRSLPYLRTS